MGRNQLVREAKAAALARMEEAARTKDDFKKVITQWNHNDSNRERRERYWEKSRSNEEMLHWDRTSENDEKGRIKEGLDTVIPRPLEHEWWRQLIRGDFIDTIFDCPHELHELVEDADIFRLLQDLSENRKEALYYSAIRLHSNIRIATFRKQTDRAVRKLLAATINSIRDKLAPLIRERIEVGFSQTTFAEREFLDWYDKEKTAAIDSDGSE